MSGYVIGIDLGTGSTKGVLTDASGTVLASARRDHRIELPRPGWAQMDPALWWDETVAVLAELTAQAPGPVAGVCVSGMGPCVAMTGADGRPIGPAPLYGIDTRAEREIDRLEEQLGAGEILRRGGSSLSGQAAGAKLLWWTGQDEYDPRGHWHSSHTFVVELLTGEWVMDHHTASQFDPFHDLGAQVWNEEWFEDFLPGLGLPRLAWPGEIVGHVTAEAARATGLAVGTPVCAGTVDAWAEAYSAGVRRPGDLMLMYGSTMFLVQYTDQIKPAPVVWGTLGVTPDSRCVAAGMSTAGSLTQWMADLVSADFADLVAEARQVPAGSEGLVMLPYFLGERTPIHDSRARGAMLGLTLRHGRGHLFRAAYEAVGYGVRSILEPMTAAAAPPRRIVAVGGGTTGGLSTQIVSDITGLAQEIPETTVGASYGDALLAAQAVGLVGPGEDWARIGEIVEPDPAPRAAYETGYGIYRDLYPATRDLMHRLADS